MSWLYSQALVAAFSADTCSDGARSALSSGTPTPRAFCAPDKMTAFSRPSRFGMTFGPLTDDLGAELLTWFLAGSHARTSALQGTAQELMGRVLGYGKSLRGSLAMYDHDSSMWKTAQCSLLADSQESSVTWPRWGSIVDGVLYPLPTLVRSMYANASGSWPTPTVCGNYNRKGASKTSGDGLATAVAKRMFPTPSAGNDKWGGTIQECGGSWNWIRKEDPSFARSPLNPTWVEWLMGWPLGWTDLDASATDKYRNVPRLRGAA